MIHAENALSPRSKIRGVAYALTLETHRQALRSMCPHILLGNPHRRHLLLLSRLTSPEPRIGLFRSFNTARRTIASFEAMLWPRKGFGFAGGWTVNDQNELLKHLFGFKRIIKRENPVAHRIIASLKCLRHARHFSSDGQPTVKREKFATRPASIYFTP